MGGVERAVFGGVSQGRVDAWLGSFFREVLDVSLRAVTFRSGRVSAVYGCVLDGGRHVAVKVHRTGADVEYLTAAVEAQRVLAGAGYPCPRPVHGPVLRDGRAVVVESLLSRGELADATVPAVRRALAVSLAQQVRILSKGVDDRGVIGALRSGAPAWVRYENGPWPVPHDSMFDFSVGSGRFAWVDELAAAAAQVLRGLTERAVMGAEVVAHSDWYDGNVLMERARTDGGSGSPEMVVSAAFDWDSLAARPEAVLVGLNAGSYTAGGAANPVAPTVEQVAAFVEDYERARGGRFTGEQRAAAAAAATWVLSYNARCQACFLAPGVEPAPGTALHALRVGQHRYLELRS